MFRLPVSDVLTSYPGYTKTVSFSWDVYRGYYEDFDFTSPLKAEISLRNENSKKITVTILFLETRIRYQEKETNILLENISRTYRVDTDGDGIVDLAPFIHESILETFIKAWQKSS